MLLFRTIGHPLAAIFLSVGIVCQVTAQTPPAHAQAVTAQELAQIQASLNEMRAFYEKRIDSLEKKVDALQKQNADLNQRVQNDAKQSSTTSSGSDVTSTAKTPAGTVVPSTTVSTGLSQSTGSEQAVQASAPASTQAQSQPQPTLARGITLPKIGALTPEISLILDGKYSAQSQNPDLPMRGFMPSGAENIPRGFSLGESELALAGTVDNLFRAEARFVFSQDGSGTGISLEEAFFETLGLPSGFKLKGGKFFSDVGYLNNKHPHEWDFVDLPLAYKAFFGGQLNNTGGQLKWVAPLDEMYFRLGGEYAQGNGFPTGDNYNNNKPLIGTIFAKAGGDLGISSSWQGGLSYVRASTGDRPRVSTISDTDTFDFNGTTNVYIADFVYKWAPNGNASRQNLKLQGEFFWNAQNGSGALNSTSSTPACESPCLGNAYMNTQKGFYVQAIYQFMPRWRVGYRYDQLYSGSSNYGLSNGVLNGTVLEAWNPYRNTVMLDWANSEYSMFRLQLARDTTFGPGLTNNQIYLQYVMSLGAHSAHRY